MKAWDVSIYGKVVARCIDEHLAHIMMNGIIEHHGTTVVEVAVTPVEVEHVFLLPNERAIINGEPYKPLANHPEKMGRSTTALSPKESG